MEKERKMERKEEGREEGRKGWTVEGNIRRGRCDEGTEGGKGGTRDRDRGREEGWFLPQSLLSCTTSSDWSVCGVTAEGGWEAR